MKTILEDAWDEVQNVCGIWVYETLGAEFDRLTTELAEAREEAKVWKDRYRKRGYVMDEHAKALERAEVAEAELAEASTIANNNYEVILKCNRQINDLKRELARYRICEEVEG